MSKKLNDFVGAIVYFLAILVLIIILSECKQGNTPQTSSFRVV